MSHARLMAVNLKHSYYSSGLCGDFALVPDLATERLLKNHRCVLKPRLGGVDVYIETAGDGKPKITFWPDAAFSFELRLQNADFPLFTDSMPLAGSGGWKIHYPSDTAQHFFARVEIQHDFNQVDGKHFDIAFSAKPVLWVYYLLANPGGSGADFSLAGGDIPGISWKRRDGEDGNTAKLASQYPGARCLRFVSSQAIPCREAGVKGIQLLVGGNAVAGGLPNPSWRNYFQTETEVQGKKADAIFQIVKYLSNTTLTKV